MSGSWEARRYKVNVLVGTPHTGIIPFAWAFGLRNLILPERATLGQVSGQPFDMARNTLGQMVFDQDAEWLFFLDSDVVLPADGLLRLLSHGKPLVSGIYYRRSLPLNVPCVWNETQQGIMFMTDYPRTHAFEADLVGAGCLLVHRSVLEKLPRPWFQWTLDKLPKPEGCSEDFYFLRRCRKELGVRPLIDPRVQCEHVGLFAAGHAGVFPAGDQAPVIDRFAWVKGRAYGKIVDIGSNNAVLFGPDAENVTCVDMDAYPIKNFVQADAANIPLPDKSFDCAVLGEILEHVPDPVKVLKEAKRLARHKVIFSTPNEFEWDARHKPFDTLQKHLESGKKIEDLMAEGTKGSVAHVDDREKPHLWHVRHFNEKMIRDTVFAAFGNGYKFDVLRYDGWSFFVAECDANSPAPPPSALPFPDAWEPWLADYIPGDGEIAVDVGAYIGGWTRSLSRRFKRVIAFEPNAENVKKWVSEFGNPENVELRSVAVSHRSGELTLHGGISGEGTTMFPIHPVNGEKPPTEFKVPCVALDDVSFAGKVSFIKIDTEGAEYEVLRGARKLIEREHPKLLIEIHSEENGKAVRDFLDQNGYSVQKVYSPNYPAEHPYREKHFWLVGLPPPKDITFYVNRVEGGWTPDDPRTWGGSEESVVLLAEALARKGFEVSVFQNGSKVAEHNGVKYAERNNDPSSALHADVLISMKDTDIFSRSVARKKFLWTADPNVLNGKATFIDKVVALSEWHRRELVDLNQGQRKELFAAVPLGVRPELKKLGSGGRNPHRVIYASSFDRGLGRLLNEWPEVLKKIPDAELHIYYGWEIFDKMTANGTPETKKVWAEFRADLSAMIAASPRTTFHGRVCEVDLTQAFLESAIWAYPCTGGERFCLTGVKAQLLGAVPVVIPTMALAETVRFGKKIKAESFGKSLVTALKDVKWQEKERKKMREDFEKNSPTWDDVAARFQALWEDGK